MSINLPKLVETAVNKRMKGYSWERIVHEIHLKLQPLESAEFNSEFDEFKNQCLAKLKKEGSLLL
jgi:hypothetical protein